MACMVCLNMNMGIGEPRKNNLVEHWRTRCSLHEMATSPLMIWENKVEGCYENDRPILFMRPCSLEAEQRESLGVKIRPSW